MKIVSGYQPFNLLTYHLINQYFTRILGIGN